MAKYRPNTTACAARTISALAVAAGMMIGPAAYAEDIDYVALSKSKVLKCLHPTVNVDKTTIEVEKAGVKSGDITTSRLKAFYPGLIKNNSVEYEISVRSAGSIRQMMVKVLADTGMSMKSCGMTTKWEDF